MVSEIPLVKDITMTYTQSNSQSIKGVFSVIQKRVDILTVNR